MRYYIDTEFIEGTQVSKCPFRFITGKRITKPTIDLISIGIVAEDGREYYAISKEFNLEEAWNRYDLIDIKTLNVDKPWNRKYWLRENVLRPIYYNLMFGDSEKRTDEYFTYKNLKKLINKHGKTNKQITFEIVNFVHGYNNMGNWLGSTEEYYNTIIKTEPKDKPEFYGYYADYDWVVFCWLFGKMNDLPNGFPKYCYDLKQELELKQKEVDKGKIVIINYSTFDIRQHKDYPKITNEYHALADAHWNKKLHEFLLEL